MPPHSTCNGRAKINRGVDYQEFPQNIARFPLFGLGSDSAGFAKDCIEYSQLCEYRSLPSKRAVPPRYNGFHKRTLSPKIRDPPKYGPPSPHPPSCVLP
ncbi:hypothetical protein Poly41_39040 [Novipirellula artificiosorum]|uniref:Uncharacterized protein n=1 Tax=Novipirellula artificiosorum TaxID=2528016 RepID=A0A5C6DKI9_9BACT|nr:hypothetical protein Poly41_39040 [Novipirellula artificiosorum]